MGYPENPHLWQGLAKVELKTKRIGLARKYFGEAISADPEFPNSYHALARLEHKEGNIREAIRTVRNGIQYCPTNHRLYHALGGLFLEANLFQQAQIVLKKGMKFGPNWSQSFFYTSLAHAAYELEGVQEASKWLRKGVSSNPMHAQGWVSLGEIEQSEENYEEARKIFNEAIEIYEDVRLKKKKNIRMGDTWRNVYLTWAKMEEKLGNIDKGAEIYLRAAKVFPKDWNILTTFAISMTKKKSKLSRPEIKSIFERACNLSGKSHANPYRQYALYERSLSNYKESRAIFLTGAESVSTSYNRSLREQDYGLTALFYDWGLMEHEKMKSLKRARVLLDEALSLVSLDTKLRANILCSIGNLEFSRKNYYVAKHFACLSINESENIGCQEAWLLWAKVADNFGEKKLANNCRIQADIQAQKKKALFIDEDDPLAGAKLMKEADVKKMLCKTPWERKLMFESTEGLSLAGSS